MKRWMVPLIFSALFLLSACASPKERFVEAASKEGTVTDKKVLECAADKLQTKLSEEDFGQLVDQLEKISTKEMKTSDASPRLMGAMTVATGACAVSSIF